MAAASVFMDIADILKRRGIHTVHYFHTDHFEPWSPRIEEATADLVAKYADAVAKIDFAHRPTLFYKAPFHFNRTGGSGGRRISDDDPVSFHAVTEQQDRVAKQALDYLNSKIKPEYQIHIHHENFTSNTSHKEEFAPLLNTPDAKIRDGLRLDLATDLALDVTERHCPGFDRTRWFFIHGQWALNASDPSVCMIEDEMARLMAKGCRGDFTFPAGRSTVDPRYEAPFLVKPVTGLKSYDFPEADPEFAWGAGDRKDKFFIWASKIKHIHCSLDFYGEGFRRNLADVEAWAKLITEQCFAVDGRLFIKTHGHMLHPEYARGVQVRDFPHANFFVQRLLGMVLEAAAKSGVAVAFSTASEVFDLFVEAQPAASQPKMTEFVDKTAFTAEASTLKPRKAAEHATEVAAFAVSFVGKKIEELGEKESGAGRHYSDLIARKRIFAEADPYVAYFLQQQFPESAIHVGYAGFGQLPALLAMNGLAATGFEPDAKRLGVGQSMLQAMGSRFPQVQTLASLTGGHPSSASVNVSNTVACFTDFMTRISPADESALLSMLRQYRAVLIDADRFVVRRGSTEERVEFGRRMMKAGFSEPTLALDLRAAGYFLLFRNALPA